MVQYNSWPLGSLPEHWRRPEPDALKELGYEWDDPRDINIIFESKLAEFSGSKFAILTDCCTNAIFLSLSYLVWSGKLVAGTEVEIPNQTYISIPHAVQHAGLVPRLVNREWAGVYEIGRTGVIDGAGRFTEGMFETPDKYHCLSFQIKKRLPIGRGGVVLTDDPVAAQWIRRASYDGRDLSLPYDDPSHASGPGWHMYMTPEDAARGIILMDQIDKQNEDTMTFRNYPPISSYSGIPAGWVTS